jgi:hypothetical protein
MRTLLKGRRNRNRWLVRRAILEHERGKRAEETGPVYDWDERVAAIRAEILSGDFALPQGGLMVIEGGAK